MVYQNSHPPAGAVQKIKGFDRPQEGWNCRFRCNMQIQYKLIFNSVTKRVLGMK